MPLKLLDPKQRQQEKQTSREQDQQRQEQGEISPAVLNQDNGFFAALDLSTFRIASLIRRKLR
jgi:hypothetical protein